MVLKMLWNGTFSVFNRVTNFDYYSIAHVEGKRYTRVSRGDPVSYTRVSNCLHADAMWDTRTRVERMRV